MGVLGQSQGAYGVLGVSFGIAPDGIGLLGSSTTGGDGVVGFVGNATGVVGNSIDGNGVYGISGTANGVVGENYSQPGDPADPLPAGVVGRSELGNGVTGESTSGSGVFGLNDGAQSGVWGSNCSNDPGIGVKGTSLAGSGVAASSLLGDGVYGDTILGNGVEGFSSRGPAYWARTAPVASPGVFLGNVRITGDLSKAGGGFEIDHPLDPENKYLSHSFVESPDMLNVYNGTATTDDNGEAVVALPGYFNVLNHQCCYQLTVIGSVRAGDRGKRGRPGQRVHDQDQRAAESRCRGKSRESGRTHGRSRTALRRRPRRPLRNGDATCILNCGASGMRLGFSTAQRARASAAGSSRKSWHEHGQCCRRI